MCSTFGHMDLLTQVLHDAGLVRRLLDLRRLAETHALRFPCERSIGLHVVTQGQLWLHAPALPAPVALGTGDIAFMARGCTHVLSTDAVLRDRSIAEVTGVASTIDARAIGDDDSRTGSHVLSGAYQLWHTPLHPLLSQLPPWFILRAAEIPQLAPLALAVGLMRTELDAPELGSQSILHGLLDAVFAYVLREVLQRQASTAGIVLRDASVQQAVALMHDDCAQPWTLEALAARVGLSRTGFAARFRDAVGDTPLQYLRTIRMQHAMRLLSETSHSLEQLALAVGYHDAFSFSKVFKRTVGVSPRDFRRRDAEERASPYRFAAS